MRKEERRERETERKDTEKEITNNIRIKGGMIAYTKVI